MSAIGAKLTFGMRRIRAVRVNRRKRFSDATGIAQAAGKNCFLPRTFALKDLADREGSPLAALAEHQLF